MAFKQKFGWQFHLIFKLVLIEILGQFLWENTWILSSNIISGCFIRQGSFHNHCHHNCDRSFPWSFSARNCGNQLARFFRGNRGVWKVMERKVNQNKLWQYAICRNDKFFWMPLFKSTPRYKESVKDSCCQVGEDADNMAFTEV